MEFNKNLQFSKKDNMNFNIFALKSLLLAIPGVLLGYYIDKCVEKWKNKETFGGRLITYITIQTAMMIVTIYILYSLSHGYTSEFQNTYPGLFFGFLFFGIQVNYITNWQKYLN